MIIARPVQADRKDDLILPAVLPLREAPSPGDTIQLQDGRRLLVIRRCWMELPADPQQASNSIDIELTVRESK